MFQIFIPIVTVISLVHPLYAAPLNFNNFLNMYQSKSLVVVLAQQELSQAQNTKVQQTDFWKSRLEATPQLGFNAREFEAGGGDNVSNRSKSLSAQLTQGLPTGTSLELNGQKFIENQNPIFQVIDRSYSIKLNQDLIRNSFGKSQRAQSKKAKINYEVSELKFQQSRISSCEEAFNLYASTYIHQEITTHLKSQLKDAREAQKTLSHLYKDRLINKIDKLSSESDYINTLLRTEQSEQQYLNNKRQIKAYHPELADLTFNLLNPSDFLTPLPLNKSKTLKQLMSDKQLQSQELEIERARSERLTDLKLGLEAGEQFGRARSGGALFNFNEDYLMATLTVGFDLINNSENSQLTNAINIKNALSIQQNTMNDTQTNFVESLYDSHQLLKSQIQSSERQVKILEEKMNLAFNQMKRAKLDFETYLLHRNSYLNQKINYLNLSKDLWLNHFSILKEFAFDNPKFCEASI